MRIDGSYGEGGGQILRTAVALSAITGEEVEIYNIRAKRRNPGLRPQHLWGIKLLARMSSARVEGARVGSTRIKFSPGALMGGTYEVDVGTAGSITLILQTTLIPAIFADSPLILKLRGGTDVPFSPPIDYYRFVLQPLMQEMGASVEINVVERGYYPKGGGVVEVRVEPSELKPLHILERGAFVEKEAHLNMRNLPMHVVERMREKLKGFRMVEDIANGPSTGCGLVLLARYKKTIIAGDHLCRRGLPAERVAYSALEKLHVEMQSKATVDVNMGDHLIPFGFLAGEAAYVVREITGHIHTNAWVVQQFGGRVEIKENTIRIHA